MSYLVPDTVYFISLRTIDEHCFFRGLSKVVGRCVLHVIFDLTVVVCCSSGITETNNFII